MPLFQSTSGQPPLLLAKDGDRVLVYALTQDELPLANP